MSKITNYGQKPKYLPSRPGELYKSFLDNRKARKILGWTPETSFKDGLKETVEFFSTRLGK
jgi:UDP-glucose 4-epimerase